ncbi:MAG: phosphoenolpyruvate synthase, partial [Muribaculaceae bacterium]|nr:phosphoenolpyruvate synthase [Muribaculaceae bacterium]
ILHAFLNARLPDGISDDLSAIYDVMDSPLALRSSSLLEDSHYQPFAGVYATYMIPHLPSREQMLPLIEAAVKAVYASVFYAESKAYMVATSNVIDQEKMAVIIQEVVGVRRGEYYYPSFAGVGRSLNYYPVGSESPADGVVQLAAGLGKHIVDGGTSLRFSPKNARRVLQTSTTQLALRDTQTQLLALHDSHISPSKLTVDEGFDIASLSVQDEADKGNLKFMISTYDAPNDRLVDFDMGKGRKVITFANVLQHNVFPLAEISRFMLETGQKQMGRPVEVEFAGIINDDANTNPDKGVLYWLQIRPMVDRSEMPDDQIVNVERDKMLIYSTSALGHGLLDGIMAIVMVKPEKFSLANNWAIASEIEKINRNFTDRGKGYILVGPGRWGSSDPALGVPVRWASVANARIIIETAINGRFIEPSQGTHFFHNLTSCGAGYFTMSGDDSFISTSWLEGQRTTVDAEFVKVIEFDKPLTAMINGSKGVGVVLKP